MKYLKYFLIAGMVLLTSSYTTRTSEISVGTISGNLMPDLVVKDEAGRLVDLKDLKGVKILVNFWAAYDAESHLKNVQLWNALKKENYPVVLVSVSFDRNRSVFEKTLIVDGIDSKYQFYETDGASSDIFKEYGLEKGFKSFLIDENGVIIKENVTTQDLRTML